MVCTFCPQTKASGISLQDQFPYTQAQSKSPPIDTEAAADSTAVFGFWSKLDAGATPTQRLDIAVNALRRSNPECSAATRMSDGQRRLVIVAIALLIFLITFAPVAVVPIVLVALTFPFLCVIAMRLAAIWVFASEPTQVGEKLFDPDRTTSDLPRYTLIIPLFREAQMVPGLIAALDAIDYPKDRLDVLFALEAIDIDTIDALASTQLEPHMRVIVVPDGKPRTKPRAANYALTYARGDYVVVYDAEDLPEPRSIEVGVAGFRDGPSKLGCLQARLNIDNPNQSWFSRQFTIEYSALFDGLLPMLQYFGLPIPLGGTSNHFPRRVLEGVGGWDPYNVTEDADLGIRLARRGLEVAILPSTTWEEAPITFAVWLGQRTRWLKGWMQTYLVHMRSPAALLRDLGLCRFAGLQILMGGMIFVSARTPLVLRSSHS